MKKQQDHAFRKDVYLLGSDAEGIKYWLEAPSWDCDWYCCFGYIETYRNNRTPSKAVDIDSHQHADGKYIPNDESVQRRTAYNSYTGDTNIFTGQFLVNKTFDEKEGWRLRELMATFYQLKSTAAMFGRGGMHQTENPLKEELQDAELAKRINEKLIPAITDAILSILTPEVK